MDSDPYRILGIPRDATKKQIHQAYLDMVRVWHPDRFQSDSRLQRIAQDHLREINEAYGKLRIADHRQQYNQRADAHRDSEAGTTTTNETFHGTAAHSQTPRFRPHGTIRNLRQLVSSRLLLLLAMAIGGFTFFAIGFQIITLLRPPVLDIDLIEGRARLVRPQILTPSRVLDAASGVEVAADTLTEWARGEVLNLWTPASSNATVTPAPTIVREIPTQAPQGNKDRWYNPKQSSAERFPDLPNGTELITAGRGSGAGELRFVNNTELEEIATLLRRKVALRAIYIKPKNDALLQSVETGIYDVQLELGRGLDPRRLRFHQSRFSPDTVGPFEFMSITTAAGTTGQHYEIVLKTGSNAERKR